MSSSTTSRWRLGGRELAIIFLFWTSLATLSAVNRLLDPRAFGLRLTSPRAPILLGYVECWTWAAATPFIFWLSSRFSPERSSRWLIRVLVLLGIGLVIGLGVYLVIEMARLELFESVVTTGRRRGPPPLLTPFRELARFRFLNQLLVYMAILAAGFAREYFVRDRARAAEAAVLESQAAMLRAQLADARLDALRMQLNPHFLFNTLHAISALVERDPGGVRRMIARLSELLRYTLDRRGDDEVPLSEELRFLDRYIEIMEIRFQGRLKIERRIADEAASALVPNLILQPIVENALEHGAARASGEGRIEITARRDGETLRLSVRDNGPGPGAANEGGVGLANTRARLAQLYGDEGSVTLTAAPDGGALAEITLPWQPGVRS
jgi:two-component system LytT family sensor kinase